MFVVPIAVLVAALLLPLGPAPVRASAATDAESLVVDLVNADRAVAGLAPLYRLPALDIVAGDRAAAMAAANVANHTVGGDIGDALDRQDVTWYGYGEAVGYTTAAWAGDAARDLMRMWMASPPHRTLLMSRDYDYIGVGLAYRSSNGRTFGSIILTDSVDGGGAPVVVHAREGVRSGSGTASAPLEPVSAAAGSDVTASDVTASGETASGETASIEPVQPEPASENLPDGRMRLRLRVTRQPSEGGRGSATTIPNWRGPARWWVDWRRPGRVKVPDTSAPSFAPSFTPWRGALP